MAARAAALLLAALALSGCTTRDVELVEEEAVVVATVSDGDTLQLQDGRRVRLVQIDAPELSSGECYGREARAVLLALAPPGTRVRLQGDPRLDEHDRFGRLLRYVLLGERNVNLALVRRGAAAPYFYRGDRGRYSGELLRGAKAARAARKGLWGACPLSRLDPGRGVATGGG